MNGGDGAGEVHDALFDELGRLTGKASFTVAELAVDSATIFEVSRDEHGTPTASRWTYAYEDDALRAGGAGGTGGADQWSGATAGTEGFYRHVAPKFIVRTTHQLPAGLLDLLPDPPEVPVYESGASLAGLLRAAMKQSPLLLSYELAVLKRGPLAATARSGSP